MLVNSRGQTPVNRHEAAANQQTAAAPPTYTAVDKSKKKSKRKKEEKSPREFCRGQISDEEAVRRYLRTSRQVKEIYREGTVGDRLTSF